MELQKIDSKYFDLILDQLSTIERQAPLADQVLSQLHLLKMDFKILKLLCLCFHELDASIMDEHSRSMINLLTVIWEEENGPLAVRLLHASLTGDVKDWHLLALELQGKIQQSKLETEAWCVNLIHLSFQCKASSTNSNIFNYLDSILHNLKDLVSYRDGKNVMFKKQIETLEDTLVFMRNMLKLSVNGTYCKELEEFNMLVQVFANNATCLTFQYWAKYENVETATQTNLRLSHLLQKIKPATPDVARLYIGILKSVHLHTSDSLMFTRTAVSFVDLFLEDLMSLLKDELQNLRDNIIVILTFSNEPPKGKVDESICSQIDLLFSEDLYVILPFDDIEIDFSKKKVILSDFMKKIETISTHIDLFYCNFPDSSIYNFPKVISPLFLDFLIQNLRNLKARMISDREYVPFAKYKIVNILEELVVLSPLFNQFFDLQSEQKETWLQVVNILHLTEYVICSSLSSWFVFDYPIWYHMAYLSDVLDKIKVVNRKLKKILENMYNVGCSPRSASFISTLSGQAMSTKTNELLIGFEDEVETIIGKLTWGHRSLDIVSIVGMGGLGKTTLAKKVYGSSLVKSNFDIFAFCSVSQDYNARNILLDILCDMKRNDNNNDMSKDDLAHKLWKCLSRQKYLIVLDDVWSSTAWNEVKSSFPDDKNGSRIMFTTRSRDVADRCKINCIPHHLRFLSDVESCELLRKKVFQDDISPPNLYEIAKVIAKNCKGLPLAVVVIAGLLARTDRSQSSWSKIAKKVGSHLSNGVCMEILKLSYTHLPEYLKPCLLYLGAFPEDELIRVKHVILLWIAEGFVQESETKSIEDVAKEYLRDLVDRSLVIVRGRSSSGDIKKVGIHDLIHDMCRMKCGDGNFFPMGHGYAPPKTSHHSLYKPYRLSTEDINDIVITTGTSLPYTRSLLFFSEVDTYRRMSPPLKKLKLAQVLHLGNRWEEKHMNQLAPLIHLRHMKATIMWLKSIPISISNMWNIQSLIVEDLYRYSTIDMPETLWRMKTLRHVKVTRCKLTFSDSHEHDACPLLDNVVSFASPLLSSGKDVEQLIQRLPAVRKLSCVLDKSIKGPGETLGFYWKLESLKLAQYREGSVLEYLINFPSTLKKLTLDRFQLPWTVILAIAELQCLQVLKLRENSFLEPTLEMEDLAFPSLEFFELNDSKLVQWKASTETFPCLEQLLIKCKELGELPSCFGEISSLKRIVVTYSPKAESSAIRIQEEQMELGKEVEVLINI